VTIAWVVLNVYAIMDKGLQEIRRSLNKKNQPGVI
jgi:hypothetical protein